MRTYHHQESLESYVCTRFMYIISFRKKIVRVAHIRRIEKNNWHIKLTWLIRRELAGVIITVVTTTFIVGDARAGVGVSIVSIASSSII